MASVVESVAPVSPQSYILSLMEDVDDEEEDIRIHTAAACGDEEGLNSLLQNPEYVKKWINYRIRPYLAPPIRVAVTGNIVRAKQNPKLKHEKITNKTIY